MAGSYKMAVNGWSLIEDMGDAYEAVEQMLYLINCFADEHDIKEAMDQYYRYRRGEDDPNEKVTVNESEGVLTDFGKAYLESQAAMQR